MENVCTEKGGGAVITIVIFVAKITAWLSDAPGPPATVSEEEDWVQTPAFPSIFWEALRNPLKLMGLSFLASQGERSIPSCRLGGQQGPRGPAAAGQKAGHGAALFQGKGLYVDIAATRSGESTAKMPFTCDGHVTLKATPRQVGIVIYYCCCLQTES